MNVYISKNYKQVFLEKLKEITIIDDYILDRERLGKEKIKIHTSAKNTDVILELIDILPVDSMIVDQSEYPGKEYILCVGEITMEDFSLLINKDISFSIVTIKDKTIRFNAWIHFSLLESIFVSQKILHFSSISGKIKEQTFFIIETTQKYINDIHEYISTYTTEFIIKDNKFYVKLLMHDFTNVFHSIKHKYTKIEIIDERVF